MRKQAGFTLIELAIAVVILILIMLLAVPSMNGLMADRRLRRSLDEFNSMVRQAQERSVAERRAYLMVWEDGKVGLRPEALREGDDRAPVLLWKLARNESLKVNFPAALIEKAPAEWIFWSSGNCEPAEVSFKGEDGTWTARYSALTGRAEIVSYVAR